MFIIIYLIQLTMRGVYWIHPGSLYITTLHGYLTFLRGLTHLDPPLFLTAKPSAPRRDDWLSCDATQ